MKYTTYKIFRADDSVEIVRVPDIFDSRDVIGRLRHSLIFMYVPKNYQAYTETEYINGSHTYKGPGWLYVSEKGNLYWVDKEPSNAMEAWRMIKDI